MPMGVQCPLVPPCQCDCGNDYGALKTETREGRYLTLRFEHIAVFPQLKVKNFSYHDTLIGKLDIII